MEETNRLPASALTVPELVEALVCKPEFLGVVIYDPNHVAEATYDAQQSRNFNWRSNRCDPLMLCANMIPTLASIPRGPTPAAPSEGNGQQIS